MEVNSIITGKRGVSLPFTDYSDPIFEDAVIKHDVKIPLGASPPLRGGDKREGEFHRILDEIVEYGRKASWKSVELRLGNGLPHDTPSSVYYGHSLSLSPDEEKVSSTCRERTRRNIKKAVAEGVTVEHRSDLDAVREFYRLNCITRKEHGLPPQPYRFFPGLTSRNLSRWRSTTS